MKGLKTILGIALATTALGGAVAFGVASNADNASIKPAEAVSSVKSGDLFFVDCSSFDWYKDSAYIGLYFFGGSSTATFTDFKQDRDSNNTFWFTVPGNNQTFTTLIALRKGNANKDWSGEWNRVADFSISGNGIKITGWGSAESITVYGGINSGNQVYVNYNDSNLSWWDADVDNYMFFCNELNGAAGGWVKMNKVQGTTDKLLECTVPGNSANFGTMIATRVVSGEEPAGDWSNVYNQTVDYNLISQTTYTESSTKNAMVLENTKDGNKQKVSDTWSYSIGADQRAQWYGSYFIEQTNTSCSNKVAPAANVWTSLENEYKQMHTAAKNIVKNATASASSTVSYEEAMRRYDLIVSLRGSSNFMGRNTSGGLSSNRIGDVIKKNSPALVIIIVSVVSISSVGLFFIIRKKKHQ